MQKLAHVKYILSAARLSVLASALIDYADM